MCECVGGEVKRDRPPSPCTHQNTEPPYRRSLRVYVDGPSAPSRSSAEQRPATPAPRDNVHETVGQRACVGGHDGISAAVQTISLPLHRPTNTAGLPTRIRQVSRAHDAKRERIHAVNR